jgi:uncharacterized protein
VSVSQTSLESSATHLAEPPQRSWRWSQMWRDLFFAHWQVPVNALRQLLPGCLEIDIYRGAAWVSIVAFRLDVRHRWLPSLGFCTNFLELNLRTYVRWQGEGGIYFLSIHADSRIAVNLARLLTPLPYAQALLSYRRTGKLWQLQCLPSVNKQPQLEVQISPTTAASSLACDSVEAWLLDRYRAFVPDKRERLHRMVARHPPWSVQPVATDFHINTLGKHWGLDLGRQPDLAHFAARMPALIWPFEIVHEGNSICQPSQSRTATTL